MIKNVFIPEKIGGYYLFKKRILGVDIGRTQVSITQLLLHGTTITVERSIKKVCDHSNGGTNDERIIVALRQALQEVDPYDAVHTTISSSLVVFKELKLPFTKHYKIRQVLDFEVEPLLPFSLDESIVDFVITKTIAAEKSSELLVAAVQKQHVERYCTIFRQAGVVLSVLSVDLFDLYRLYRAVPSYQAHEKTVALIDIGAYETRIAYVQAGQLRLVRSLSEGVVTIARQMAEALGSDSGKVMEELIRFGLQKPDDPTYRSAGQSAIQTFCNAITFTLNSFSSHTDGGVGMSHIILFGGGAQIAGVSQGIEEQVGVATRLFSTHSLLEIDGLKVAPKNNVDFNFMSIAAALPAQDCQQVNFLQKEFAVSGATILWYRQCFVFSVLLASLFIALGFFYFFDIHALRLAADEREKTAKLLLEDSFRSVPVDDLDMMVSAARSEVGKEEKLWSSFNPSRVSYLHYLLELTSRIDVQSLGFSIDSLKISDDTMVLSAHVKDFDALHLLEKELRQSKLFRYVEQQDEPDFTMTIKLAVRK